MFNFENEVEFIPYDSEFKSEIDLGFQPEDHTYSDEWVLSQEIEDKIIERARCWSTAFGFDFDHELEKAQDKGLINAIISVTGDDEIMTANCVILCVLHLATVQVLSEIEISEKDTGISRRKGNYTEGWVLLCPASEADFTSVVLRHHRDGVPLVFDITKLKATSAVRKQSTLEMDLESKYGLLNKAAEWVDRDWFTYDYAQMSLVFATCIFDFSSARIFPYLYKSEGGCGGKPPWNNVNTAYCALSYFNKGNSTKSVLALMDECRLINEFKLQPKNALYVNASHYAQTGNSQLARISNAQKYLRSFDKETRIEILESCKGVDSLPRDLIEKSLTIEPRDKLVGSAVAELRKNGLLMTELDVQLKQIGLEKFSDLLKDENMGLVRQRREEEKKAVRKNGLAQIAKFSQSDITLQNIEEMAIPILSGYYRLRSDISDISSLVYAGILRVFKTRDVEEYYRRHSFGLADEAITGISLLQNQNLNLKTNQALEDLVLQIDWLETGSLTELFSGEIPPSMGSDDARLARKILKSIEEHNNDLEFLVFCIITDDKRLIQSLDQLTSQYGNVRICRCPTMLYIKDCHQNISMAKVEVHNFLRNSSTKSDEVEKIIRRSIRWIGENRIQYKILYDFPNINRSLMGFASIGTRRLIKRSGGFLRRETARRISYQTMEWKKFKNLKDFESSVREYHL